MTARKHSDHCDVLPVHEAVPKWVHRWAAKKLMLLAGLVLGWQVFTGSCYGGGWYVGNTAAGEWIQYTNTYLSAGTYRFTANAGAVTNGVTLHLEVDGTTVYAGVAVPNTGQVCVLEVSTNFICWQLVMINTVLVDGQILFTKQMNSQDFCLFYRVWYQHAREVVGRERVEEIAAI